MELLLESGHDKLNILAVEHGNYYSLVIIAWCISCSEKV